MKVFSIGAQKALELDNIIETKKADYFSRDNTKHRCMCYGCYKNAINSHAISEKQSLRFISENGNMKYFKSLRKSNELYGKKLLLNPIGINIASTFKGFCSDHDNNIFYNLDNNPIRTSTQEILLQAYRSICFALFKAGFIKIQNEYSSNYFKEYLDLDKIRDFLKEDIEIEKVSDDIIMNLFNGLMDEQLKKDNKELDCLVLYKNSIENYLFLQADFTKLEEGGEEHIFSKDDCDICVLYKQVDFKIPVALLNNHFLGIKNEPNVFLVTVVPNDNSSEIYWIFEKRFLPTFGAKWNLIIKKDINILNMIESSMMCYEDWYIMPNVIGSISKQRFQIIEEDMYFTNERSPFDEYDLSIFDDLRIELIEYEDDVTKEKETKKIIGAVARKNYNERIKQYNQDVFER